MTMATGLIALSYVAVGAYVVIGVVFADLTLMEGIEKRLPLDCPRLLGVLASLVWPAVIALAIYESWLRAGIATLNPDPPG